MKILCVIDSLGSGGAQRQLVELAKGFHEHGHQVSFLTYHNLDFFNKELIRYNIDIHCIEETSYLKRLWKMRIFIRNGNYNAVLSFLEAPNFICELAGFPFRRWKLVVGERSANPTIKKSFKLKFYRWFHLLSDFVVSNSYKNRDIVKSVNPLIPLDKLKVIYNLVDIEGYSNIERYPIQDDKLILLIAASHRKVKNLDGLIEAVNLLSKKERDKLRIHWYGDEADTDLSFNKAKLKIDTYNLNDNFSFHKAIRDIKNKMLNADIVGLFSFHEGFPNTICEAMSLGKPVICASVSDVPLIITNDRYLFDPEKTGEIAAVLSYILTLTLGELQIIGENNKKVADSLFDKEHIVLEYLKLMQ